MSDSVNRGEPWADGPAVPSLPGVLDWLRSHSLSSLIGDRDVCAGGLSGDRDLDEFVIALCFPFAVLDIGAADNAEFCIINSVSCIENMSHVSAKLTVDVL
jgi:hypothetical protein